MNQTTMLLADAKNMVEDCIAITFEPAQEHRGIGQAARLFGMKAKAPAKLVAIVQTKIRGKNVAAAAAGQRPGAGFSLS